MWNIKNKKNGKNSKGEDLVYKTNKYEYNVQQYKTIRPFSKNSLAGKTTLNKADRDQSDLLNNFLDFKKKQNKDM